MNQIYISIFEWVIGVTSKIKFPIPINRKSSKLRTAIFAANRSVWISSCEACLFLETGGAAVQSHPDVAVHGRKGLFMMSECKRILNKEVVGEGLWQTDLSKCQGQQEGEVVEIQPADKDDGDVDEGDDDKVSSWRRRRQLFVSA